MLSISYIISELFLLCLNLLQKEHHFAPPVNNVNITTTPVSAVQIAEHTDIENQSCNNVQNEVITDEKNESEIFAEKCAYFESQIKNLTPAELSIYELYLSKKSTKEILDILNIKETTLKYHNKNIYSKLGVSSKKQLIEIANVICK